MVPEELRAGYRLLKNAGFLPPELKLRNEIASVEQLLAEVTDEAYAVELNRRLQFLIMLVNVANGASPVWQETYYAQKLHDKTIKLS